LRYLRSKSSIVKIVEIVKRAHLSVLYFYILSQASRPAAAVRQITIDYKTEAWVNIRLQPGHVKARSGCRNFLLGRNYGRILLTNIK